MARLDQELAKRNQARPPALLSDVLRSSRVLEGLRIVRVVREPLEDGHDTAGHRAGGAPAVAVVEDEEGLSVQESAKPAAAKKTARGCEVKTRRTEPPLLLSRSILRAWDERDHGPLVQSANNRNIWIQQLDAFPHPFTDADAVRWLKAVKGVPRPHHLAIEVDGRSVGGTGLRFRKDVYRRSAEIGYWLGEPYWGRGIMTEAVGAMVEYCFSAFDLCRIFASVFDGNPASIRVLEKAKFQLEGRLRKAVTKGEVTRDLLLYSIVR